MDNIRPAAVAGMFYPAGARELQNTVEEMLAAAAPTEAHPKAMIVPHAGYIYSGPVAASAYRLLQQRPEISRVVLLGPSHRVPLLGIAASSALQFATPLGNIPLDRETIQLLLDKGLVSTKNEAHAMEHSLEVHLPFLQVSLHHDFQLVPLVVGESTPEQVAAVLAAVWGGEETLIVISSDLSHFHDYDTATARDKRTSQAIENLHYQDIEYGDACGRNPVNGLLYLAAEKGLHIQTLDLRNSGDTAGSKNEVVGYGAYVCQ